MNRFLARFIGVSLGALGGVPGAAFGFLSGWLIDQYRATAPVGARMDRFLQRPDLEKDPRRLRLYSAATLLAAVLTAEQLSAADRVHHARQRSWPGAGYRWVPILDRALEVSDRIEPERIASALVRYEDGDRERSGGIGEELFRFLLNAAVPEEESLRTGEALQLRRIADALVLGTAGIELLESRLSSLDEKSCRILGVSRRAGREEMRRAYRRLASDLHPDTAWSLEPTQREEMNEAFLRVRRAYEVLTEQLDTRDTAIGDETTTPRR